MKDEWILDVLADLKAFAVANGLVALAEQLEDASMIAASEMAPKAKGAVGDAQFEPSEAGADLGSSGTGYRI